MNVLVGFLGSVEEAGLGGHNSSFVAAGRGYVFFLSRGGFCLLHQTLTLDSFPFGPAGGRRPMGSNRLSCSLLWRDPVIPCTPCRWASSNYPEEGRSSVDIQPYGLEFSCN